MPATAGARHAPSGAGSQRRPAHVIAQRHCRRCELMSGALRRLERGENSPPAPPIASVTSTERRNQPFRWTENALKACSVGIISMTLTLKCRGRVTHQATASATSSAVSGCMPW